MSQEDLPDRVVFAAGTIIAFAVPVPRSAIAAATAQRIPLFSSKIIYQVIEDVSKRVANLLPSVYEKRVSGEASVLQTFDIKLTGGRTKKIAGCRVTRGIVEKSKKAQVVRNGEVVHEGKALFFGNPESVSPLSRCHQVD